MGAAVDVLDKPKIHDVWVKVFSSTIAGHITNAYTKSDAVLILYSAS